MQAWGYYLHAPGHQPATLKYNHIEPANLNHHSDPPLHDFDPVLEDLPALSQTETETETKTEDAPEDAPEGALEEAPEDAVPYATPPQSPDFPTAEALLSPLSRPTIPTPKSPYKVHPLDVPPPSWSKPWQWPKLNPFVNIIIPINEATRLKTKNFAPGKLGWFSFLVVPFTPVFHSAWWHHDEGGKKFVMMQEDCLIGVIDENEIISPLIQEEDG